jgi:hypothetical protein
MIPWRALTSGLSAGSNYLDSSGCGSMLRSLWAKPLLRATEATERVLITLPPRLGPAGGLSARPDSSTGQECTLGG